MPLKSDDPNRRPRDWPTPPDAVPVLRSILKRLARDTREREDAR